MEPNASHEASLAAPPPAPAVEHRFVLDYYAESGDHLGSVAIEPDWQPAWEWTAYVGMRSGIVPPVVAPGACRLEPIWHEELGAPVCSSVRAVLWRADAAHEVHTEIPAAYFRELAEREVTSLVDRGALGAGDSFRYRLSAFPLAARAESSGATRRAGIQVEAVPQPLAVVDSCLDDWLSRSEPRGVHVDEDAPVFIAREVLEQAEALARDAGEMETGGVIVGRLHRDGSRPELFVEITAQIPARHAVASETGFAFTPDTWADADAAIVLRGESELTLGWWHSHPRFCLGCPVERQRACILARPFFSAEDIHLHRACFQQAYQVALLISDLPDGGLTPALFGWRSGMVAPRGFHVST